MKPNFPMRTKNKPTYHRHNKPLKYNPDGTINKAWVARKAALKVNFVTTT